MPRAQDTRAYRPYSRVRRGALPLSEVRGRRPEIRAKERRRGARADVRTADRSDRAVRRRRENMNGRCRGGRQLRFGRLREPLLIDVDIEVVVIPVLLVLVVRIAVVRAVERRRRLLPVEAEMHMGMRVGHARQEHR